MPENHDENLLSDRILTDDDKSQKTEELRKIIEGKFWLNFTFVCGSWYKTVLFSMPNSASEIGSTELSARNIQKIVKYLNKFYNVWQRQIRKMWVNVFQDVIEIRTKLLTVVRTKKRLCGILEHFSTLLIDLLCFTSSLSNNWRLCKLCKFLICRYEDWTEKKPVAEKSLKLVHTFSTEIKTQTKTKQEWPWAWNCFTTLIECNEKSSFWLK